MSVSSSDQLRDQLLVGRVLSPAQVTEALNVVADEGTELEAVLRERGLLTDVQIGALRSMRVGVPFCSLSEFLPRLANAEHLPEQLARSAVMFPVFVLDDMITLVMEDPNDVSSIDQVRRQSKKEVDVCLGMKEEILGLIERAYGASKYLEESSVAASLAEVGDSPNEEAQPIIRLVDNLINEAARQNASDIHIEPGDHELRIRIRVDGVLREVAAPPLGLHRAIVSRIKIISRLDIAKTRVPQDGAYHHRSGSKEVMIRVSILPSVFGEAAVLRILRNESDAITMQQLGMTKEMLERFNSVISNAHGMILISGPTGSGKSTTLYAAMRSIVSPQTNIITIEDPVECRSPQIRQVQVNTEASLTFASGLRSILRQDPDVIMVGEIRDKETAQISVQAALTGHLLLSTVHTNDSIGALARLRDLGIPEFLISSSLLAVLAQRLCRRICSDCAAPESPPEYLLRAVGLEPSKLDFQPMRGKGCRRCVGSGYAGRTGIYELFEVTEEFAHRIVSVESAEAIRAAAKAKGMKFLVHDGIEKIRDGLTTIEEIARVAGRC